MTMTVGTITGKELFWFNNTLVAIRISSAEGEDGICVVEHRMPHGDSPPLHVHRHEDEVFHILEGQLRVRIDGQERVAGTGETLIAPKGLPHTYRVESPEGARALTVTRGRGFETMLRQASRPAGQPELPPLSEPTPEMIEALVRICAENGIDIVGSPLS
ncbi:cupin domain-containing protein [Mesorhizobium sp. B2-3-14]|uniref:cupin domain-containing protein n=1 Tax=unclassified Mesorhizobium TaxID=325217 RepID=UPI0011276CDB|nr:MULTISPECIES: cupin domain-containing protein [unclassified Mesorhizobium]MBZ9929164.1 cupin domain-containing protein [Mesorhizobium sp. BR1-1-5]MBZ9679876.1 cupin domain-containing protein [Mesorhizobium sp. CO1-1-2]MBZ9723058.1 cupin domain-containing protein [Mesorhizobium sp. CO1-1-11]MBZ9905028.1 cupin domain-containing protein [Mesorhizobium sp. BR115XR7A]MBZ9924771.1 cupin domain-containing protein [Mesorhizobium sp. BR1-1-4]